METQQGIKKKLYIQVQLKKRAKKQQSVAPYSTFIESNTPINALEPA